MLQGHVVVVVQGADPGQALEGGMELQGSAAVGHGLALGAVVVARLQAAVGNMAGSGRTIRKASRMREVQRGQQPGGQQRVRRCWPPPRSLLTMTHDGGQRRALGPRAGGWVRALGWTGNGDR